MPELYRVGIIGSTGRGNFGHGLDTVWKEIPRCQVVAVADDSADGLPLAQKRTGAISAYADYRDMLDKERLDVVAVATRWLDRHHEFTLTALERNAHVYTEKPFCRNLVEADALVAACEMRHRQLAIAHQTRWSPPLHRLVKELKSGVIGDILELRGRGKEDARRGGGEDLWVLGSHIFDLMRVVAGDPLSCSAEVFEQGRPIGPAQIKPGNEGIGPLAGDEVHARFTFEKGVRGDFSSVRNAGAAGDGRFALQIFGTKGVAEINTGHPARCFILQDPAWSPGRSSRQWIPVTSAGLNKPEPLPNTGLHGGNVLAVNNLIDCIEQPEQSPLCNVYDARWTIEMISAVFESHRLGRPVTLPLENRECPLTLMSQAE